MNTLPQPVTMSIGSISGATGRQTLLSRRLGHLLLILIAAALTALSAPARAGGCKYVPPFTQMTISIPLSGTIAVPRDAPVNSVLYQVDGPLVTPGDPLGTCTSSGTQYLDLLTQPYANLGGNVFATSVPGVGVKILSPGGSAYPLSAPYTKSGTIWTLVGPSTPLLRYVFVKTGPITPGAIKSTDVPTAKYSLDRALTMWTSTVSGSVAFTVSACATPDVSIPMGTHLATEMTGVNSFTSSTNFNISLNNCPAGMNTVQYQIDPAPGIAVVNAANSVVGLNSGSQATGVGVQLLDGTGAAFPLSVQKTFTGYNSGTGGTYTIPMKARYYQTGATVGPGTANSAMTVTMTYQ